MNPTVSIITPCYNSEKYIAETIQSVLNQSFTDWEWIIVDDCSKDDSVEIIKNYTDKRIKLIELKRNSGAAEARNIALNEANGRYITFIDSDDVWYPHFLETTLNYLIQNEEELVYTSYKRVDENLELLLDDFTAEDKIDFKRILYNCPIPMLTALYDSKRIGKIKIPEVDKREDYAMWLNVLKKVPYARAIKEPLALYRIREASYSRNKFLILKKQFMVYYAFLNLSLLQSTYYTVHWALNGMKKYEKFKFRNRS